MVNIGEQIRNARNAKGWTQDTLAEKMAVTRSAVANWEQGRRMPDMTTAIKLMALLDCQLGDLSISQAAPESTESKAAPVFSSDEAGFAPDQAGSSGPDGTQTDAPPEGKNLSEDSILNGDPEVRASDTRDQHEGSEAASDQPAEAVPAFPGESVSAGSAAQASKRGAKAPGRLSRRKLLSIVAVALVATGVLVWLVIVPALKPKSKGIPYTSADGEVYTMERMQQTAENIPGKAYLIVNPSVQLNHGESMDYYLFEFKYHEMNGIALSINRLELVYFSKLKQNAFFINTAEDIKSQYGMTVDIPAYGDWTYTSGLPVQDTAYGVGVLLHCTDENGNMLSFTSYISFPEP